PFTICFIYISILNYKRYLFKLFEFIHNIISTMFMVYDSFWVIFTNFNIIIFFQLVFVLCWIMNIFTRHFIQYFLLCFNIISLRIEEFALTYRIKHSEI